ncbi:resistance to inhibitors of cholinesterase protein 3 isoform X2 [Bacillus rossius redtenbacheri]|uniref:resistance to inhibitors of cholinesterase protein 3 isoform X2 n=1 Tax=Bacillus rossius redtenbacheri TaxID=93214 RepID=UPI002FDE14FB
MAVEFGTGKTVLILATVVGCFAVLWPKLFYPMLLAALSQKPSLDSSQACCDVIFENDVNAIKIVVEMCGNILHQYDDVDPKLTRAFEEGRLSKDVVRTCRNEVLSKCGVDITAFLEERVRLGHTYRQILDEIRSFNSSVCLKTNFGVAPALLGAPRHMRGRAPKLPSHFRQERLPHARPEMIHPALRERGRAIPQPHVVPRVPDKEGKPVPVAGIRPPMGGAGHVVPAPKGTGTMGIIMPIYTVGIVVFFMYTIMKVMFKKPSSGPGSYPEYGPDPEFRKLVFEEEAPAGSGRPTWRAGDEPTKLGDTEIDHLRRRLEETEAAMERIVAQMGAVPHAWHSARGQAEKVVPEAAAPPTTEPGAGGERDSAETAQTAKETASEAVDEQEEDEEEVEEVDEDGEDIIPPPPLSNAVNCADEAPTTTVTTTTNYTTASAAAEATSTAGPEETAADLSALESIDPDDPDDELGDEEEVWNGDMDSEEEEESSEEEEVGPHVAASAQTPHRQHDR